MTLKPSLNTSLHDGLIRLTGELVGDAASLASDQVRRFAASSQAGTIDVDLNDVTFMDSVGMRELLTLKRTVPALRVVAVNPRLRRTFDVKGITELLLSPDTERPPPPKQ